MSWDESALSLLLALPLFGALVLLLAGPRADRWAAGFVMAIQGLGLVVALVLLAGFDTARSGEMQFVVDQQWVPELDLHFRLGVDGVSLPLVVLTSLLGFLGAVYTMRNLPEPGRPRAFTGLLLLLQIGMLGTFLSLDLLLFFVFFEVVLIPMWFLIAFWGEGQRRKAANVFILYTVLGSMVMLAGFLWVWSETGTTDMVALAALGGAEISAAAQLGAVLLIGIGLAVKTPMWPLHTWLPDAHTAAPTVGSVLLAGVLLKMGTYGMARIAIPILPEGASSVAPYVAALAVVGIVYGSLASYGQRDLKRLIAFSSVGHMGFVLFGLSTLDPVGVNAALFGNIAHGLITGLLFFVVGGIKERTHTTVIQDLPRGLYQKAPRLGFIFGFACIASLGLPGLAGFWGEFLALLGAYTPGVPERFLYRVLLVIAAIGMVLTAAYFLRIMRRVGQGRAQGKPFADLNASEAASWLPLAALVVVLGVFPGLLFNLTGPAVERWLAPTSIAAQED